MIALYLLVYHASHIYTLLEKHFTKTDVQHIRIQAVKSSNEQTLSAMFSMLLRDK